MFETRLASTCSVLLTWSLMTGAVVAEPQAASPPASSTASTKAGGSAGKSPVTIEYDHAGTNKDQAFSVSAADGELILVKIHNTCPDDFTYGVEKIERPKASPSTAAGTPECKGGDKEVDIVHEARFGGYIVDIKKKVVGAPRAIVLSGKPVELNEVKLVINVAQRKWNYEIAGAFTTSLLTDPKFGIVTRKDPADNMDKSFVVRDRGTEDKARLGVGAFIHLYHTNLPWLAGTFGLGINQSNKTTYFTGLSYRFSDTAAATVGYSWGSVDRLPPGTDTSKPVSANLLSNLGSQVKGDWFFGISYKFINPGDRFEKPFQEVPSQNTGSSSSGSGSAGSGAGAGSGTSTGGGAGSPTGSALPSPKLLSLTGTCDSVTLTWTKVAQSYRLYRGANSCGELQPLAQEVADSPYKDQPLAPNTTYAYQVQSIGNRPGGLSECKTVVTQCPH
jgi:uncharacterized membrane protein YgcG